ncbi:MAG: outer membrane protein OmpA-like peptidoglycan-associated protein [Parvicellaceae bacterium]|jgi:outer membrane protein OmpA-like peptidoglycan-associated protein/tetratricopeptide (TPR) repeat protein
MNLVKRSPESTYKNRRAMSNKLIIILVAFCVTGSWAQTNVDFKAANFKDDKEGLKKAVAAIKAGDVFLEAGNEAIYGIVTPKENFKQAIHEFQKAQKFNSSNSELNFKLGNAYLYTNEKSLALTYLEAAQKLNPEVDDFLDFYLGMSYQLGMEWGKATKHYKKFEASSKSKQVASLGKMLSKRLTECKHGTTLQGDKKRVWVDNVKEINSGLDDYSPCVSMDGSMLMFTSNRENGKPSESGYDWDHDVYVSYLNDGKFSKPKNMGNEINTPDNETTGMLSYDGTKLLLFKEVDGQHDIFESELKGSKWVPMYSFASVINTKDNQTYGSFNANQKKIYYINDRTKGESNFGTDIYFSQVMDKKTRKYEFPNTAGKMVNTKFNEGSVYMHPNGDLMFFSSEGHNSMGGYDIFVSRRKQGQWQEPENLGWPINTPYDDHFFAMTASEKYAYIASNRGGGEGGTDIYKVTFWGEDKYHEIDTEDYLLASIANPITDPQIEKGVVVKRKSLTVFKGVTLDALTDKNVTATIDITDNATGKVIETIKTNTATGKFLLSLKSGKNYGIAVKAKGYLFHSENFDIPETSEYNLVDKEIRLKNIEIGSKIALRNVFFDVGKSIVKSESDAELGRLVKLLKDVPGLKIELSGHTDNKGSESLNKKLSQDRATAVVNYLKAKGIAAGRMIAVGYGSVQPVASNKSAEGRQQNRRTEFMITAN